MNNTISPINNVSFNSRYLNIIRPESFPLKVHDAIYKSPSIENFLKEGAPKTLWEKFIDLFKKDEILTVSFNETVDKESKDIYNKTMGVLFSFSKKGSIYPQYYPLNSTQEGIRRTKGSIPKPGEHFAYKPPVKLAEDDLAQKIENMKDLKYIFTK